MASIADDESKTSNSGNGGNISPSLNESSNVPTYNFAVQGQGGKIPQVGFGTSGLKGEMGEEAIVEAIRCGYRLIDTALLYGNHAEVGNAVARAMAELDLDRDDIFITSKVGFFPPDSKGKDDIWMYKGGLNLKGDEEESIAISLSELKLKYVDLFLIHNPTASIQEYNSACLPHFFELFNYKDNDGAVKPKILPNGYDAREMMQETARKSLTAKVDMDVSYERRKASWKALEKAKRQGKCRYIGVSNYTKELLLEMKEYAEIMPAVNQLEYHPRFASKELLETAKSMGVILIGYGMGMATQISMSSDANVTSPGAKRVNRTLEEISKRMNKSKHQILARWMKQQNIIPLPRSSNGKHIRENIDIYDFELSDDDMILIDKCNENYPYYWDNRTSSITVRHAVTKAFVNTGKAIARHSQSWAQNVGNSLGGMSGMPSMSSLGIGSTTGIGSV